MIAVIIKSYYSLSTDECSPSNVCKEVVVSKKSPGHLFKYLTPKGARFAEPRTKNSSLDRTPCCGPPAGSVIRLGISILGRTVGWLD